MSPFWQDCKDGSDESPTVCKNCTISVYGREKEGFLCASGDRCIDPYYKCNGGEASQRPKYDCPDGSDEENC